MTACGIQLRRHPLRKSLARAGVDRAGQKTKVTRSADHTRQERPWAAASTDNRGSKSLHPPNLVLRSQGWAGRELPAPHRSPCPLTADGVGGCDHQLAQRVVGVRTEKKRAGMDLNTY